MDWKESERTCRTPPNMRGGFGRELHEAKGINHRPHNSCPKISECRKKVSVLELFSCNGSVVPRLRGLSKCVGPISNITEMKVWKSDKLNCTIVADDESVAANLTDVD
jgi:hypothetical protein